MELSFRELIPLIVLLVLAAAILTAMFVADDYYRRRGKRRNQEGRCARCGMSLAGQKPGPITPFGFYRTTVQGCEKCQAFDKVQNGITVAFILSIAAGFLGAMWWFNR